MLQRPRILRAALGVRSLALLGIEQHRAHGVLIEKQRQHQPDRAASDDSHWNRRALRTGIQRGRPLLYSTLIPAETMTDRQRSRSWAKKAAVSAGDEPIGVA